MRIVFMGTPDFAVSSLQALLRSHHTIAGVVTQPDRPKGRGGGLTASPVKLASQREQLPLLQPTKMKDPGFLDALRGWQPDLIVVAAFGRILPAVILQLPRAGCINVHASLLPKYRGAGPIQWAIINGEDETGISTMFMDEGMDTGDILLQRSLAIHPTDTAGSLSVRLAELGGALLVETLGHLEKGTLVRRPQDSNHATMAPLLKKEDGIIDWTHSARQIERHVRGMTPWPGSYTFAGRDRWTIWRAVPVDSAAAAPPGVVTGVTKEGISVATGDGVLLVTDLQPANSRRMSVEQYVAGHPISPGLQLQKAKEMP